MDTQIGFSGPNAGYVMELYDRFLEDPASLDAETRTFFEQWAPPPSWLVDGGVAAHEAAVDAASAPSWVLERVARVAQLARSIRGRGHLVAQIDPLGGKPLYDPGLLAENGGLQAKDLRELPATVVGGPVTATAKNAGEAIEALRGIYCSTVGYDYSHIQVAEERAWLRDAVESGRFQQPLDLIVQRALLERLTQVEAFERFLHQTYTGQKRFSIEGIDMLVPILDTVIAAAATAGTREIVMGMAHRGRLNVLAHVLGKPYSQIFVDFQRANRGSDAAPSEHFAHYGWTGDVKYHLGARKTLVDGAAVQVQITLAPNPSHLEFINPVIQGMTRASQETRLGPGLPIQDVQAALAILIHGDAAFPGEGIVAEALNISRLAGYRTGGAIHIIANNQLGFTTDPRDARSTLYASDLAKGFEIPIVHVNADDPAACMAVARLAYAYHDRFHKDFLIDLVGYRRWGHNEGDEPAYTQPLMYEQIAGHPSVRAIWATTLASAHTVSPAEAEALLQAAIQRLQAIQPEAGAAHGDEGLSSPDGAALIQTAVPRDVLVSLNTSMLERPEGFTTHSRLERILQRRQTALDPDGRVDWAHAEALAYASLLTEGMPIRLTGQDAERGTFSQRHLVLHDAVTGVRYLPLDHLPSARASFAVYNSPLSESAVLGFEYGYSSQATGVLVIWEAQYGDFANSGQVIIDQFIAAARAKWRQHPWLVLLLPHGYEGQGPEHSSGRPERFLQLAGGGNLRVASCTTAAQYFHLLRRQVALRSIDPRPLVLFTPKSLLRNPLAASPVEDFIDGAFRPVLDDPQAQSRRGLITRLILCTGKVYFDLLGAAALASTDRIAVVRVEQLYPFPDSELRAVIDSYPQLREVIWLQEEPKNMGAWSYMAPRLRDLLGRAPKIDYIGRPERASPAEGLPSLHQAEQERILAEACSGLQGPSAVVEGATRHAG